MLDDHGSERHLTPRTALQYENGKPAERRPEQAHWRRWIEPISNPLPTCLLLASALLSTWIIDTASVSAAQQDRPGIFLQGASVPRAKGLALDAALIRGWKVALSEPSFVVFETKLDQPASIGPPNALVPD